MSHYTDFTTADLISICIARQIQDGELLAQGIATPLVAAGYFLAKLTHAPNAMFASAIGNTLCSDWAPLSLSRIENLWLGKAAMKWTFAEAAGALLPSLQPKEFFRPAQVDSQGNFNNVVIGDYQRPRMRLPGCGGIADVTVFSRRVYLYVPRHSRAVFVERLDFLSGLGVDEQARPGLGPRYLVSDLGQFDFAGGRMRVLTWHPGVTLETIQARTGFELAVAPDAHETPPPTTEEIRLLREVDPLGIRELECLSGPQRRRRLLEIVAMDLLP